jgi:chemotaxis regulatin CheY-phosphate phosphatase CheZ
VEQVEEELVDQATAARTVAELRVEIGMLQRLELLAQEVRRSGMDRKWEELAKIIADFRFRILGSAMKALAIGSIRNPQSTITN